MTTRTPEAIWWQKPEPALDPRVLNAACTTGYVVEEAHRDPDGTRVITKARLYAVALVPAEAVPAVQRARRIATPDR